MARSIRDHLDGPFFCIVASVMFSSLSPGNVFVPLVLVTDVYGSWVLCKSIFDGEREG